MGSRPAGIGERFRRRLRGLPPTPPPPPSCRVIGPFIGWNWGSRGAAAVRIVVGLPHREPAWVECELLAPASLPVVVRSSPAHGEFRVFAFDFAGLAPGAACRYRLRTEVGPLDLEGLVESDLVFTAPGPLDDDDALLLVSCHNPFETASGSAEDGWAMWKEIGRRLDTGTAPRLLVLGGDQVYNDEVERTMMARLVAAPDDPELRAEVRRKLIEQYQLYWGDLSYRRVLARIPSLAMWDDHDVTDGWGGRPEQFERDGTTRPAWRAYYQEARAALAAYQAIRNPDPLPGVPAGSFTTAADLGSSRLFLLDLRTERNAYRGQIWSAGHEAAFAAALAATPPGTRRILVLSPVVAFRTNFDEDRRLSGISRLLFHFTQWLEHHRRWRHGLRWLTLLLVAGYLVVVVLGLASPLRHLAALALLGLLALVSLIPALLLKVPELPNLTDDLEDGWSSAANRPSLARLLRQLFDWMRRTDGPVLLLSGDIHLGGISEIVERREGVERRIAQVVSSPVAYKPTDKVAAGFTTTTSEMVIADDGIDALFARNIFYVSRRNFVEVVPGRLGGPAGAAPPFRFFLEGHRLPLVMPERF